MALPQEEPLPKQPVKILIAEDDPVSLKVLQYALEGLGHEVVTANNGADAWEAFNQNPTRIVVSDWMMPGLDGLGFCRKIRGRPETDYTYFMLLTARAGRENHRTAMDAGVDYFLTKPLDRDELSIRLRVATRILDFTTQIRQLKDILPICMYCKKIRNDRDYWLQIEEYIHSQTGADFSHGVCPECYEARVKPQIAALRASRENRG